MHAIYSKKDSYLKVFVGTVTGEPKVVKKDDKDAVVITLVDYKGDELSVWFHNKDGKNLADRIQKAKVTDGTYLGVLVAQNDEESESATGIDFKFRGKFVFRTDDGKETNIFMGPIARPRFIKEDIYGVSMPIDEYIDGKTETIWYDISFFNNENSANADRASKIFVEGEKAFGVIVCGAVTDREGRNGNIYHTCTGYRFQKR